MQLKIGVPIQGQAIAKFGYVQQLALQSGEVDTTRKKLAAFADASRQSDDLSSTSTFWKLLESFEAQPLSSILPPASQFIQVSSATLQAFGNALIDLRKQAVEQAQSDSSTQSAARSIRTHSESGKLGKAQHLLHVAAVATKGLEINTSVSPIGMLNLERLEMVPAGIQRGELIATIPLAPGEKTAVVQKEWSVTSKEFTSIVTDSLDNFSEKGVTDNTELAQSTTSQIQHASQFNITGTVSGGIPLISGSVTSSFGLQDTSSQSATDSRKHAVAITQKASSRTKQEHKVTISTTTVTGSSETTTRELVNPSLTDPIRIDYFSIMRKWRVRLYRYGLRLTYDIVIPEPASALRKDYATLAHLKARLGPFSFTVKHSDITDQTLPGETQPHYQILGNLFGASIIPPPKPTLELPPIGGPVENLSEDSSWRYYQLSFDVPDSYEVSAVSLIADVGSNDQLSREFKLIGVGEPWAADMHDGKADLFFDLPNFLQGGRGHQTITYRFRFVDTAAVIFNVKVRRTEEAYTRWQSEAWNVLFNAAQTNYFAEQQDIAAQISQLEDQINNVDTLTLRREENDEIMKGVLLFILGPALAFMPQDVIDNLNDPTLRDVDIEHGVGFKRDGLNLSPWDWSTARQYEDHVRFINQAIEWENVVSFLYSYFWDIPNSWDFIRKIKHPDANRQAFLRAGAARVVLTVRKGWEKAWVSFVETGTIGVDIPTANPYLSIAQEIAAYDDRNYPGIPPANPGQSAVRLEAAIYTTSNTQLNPLSPDAPLTNVEIEVESSSGFVVGAQIVIDTRVEATYTDNVGRQESTTITAIRNSSHITVAQILYPHGGNSSFYPIVQPSEKGVVIAEWNEYTPTSGTDIAVTSNLANVS